LPETPADLRHHDRLDFAFARAQTAWSFQVGERRVMVPMEATIRTDGGLGLRAMVIVGLGLARLAEFHVADDLAAWRLVEVLKLYNPGDRVEIHALCPADHGVAAAARVRVFIDFLTR
jgi:DNA-binding transcriptional LysR family regulator